MKQEPKHPDGTTMSEATQQALGWPSGTKAEHEAQPGVGLLPPGYVDVAERIARAVVAARDVFDADDPQVKADVEQIRALYKERRNGGFEEAAIEAYAEFIRSVLPQST